MATISQLENEEAMKNSPLVREDGGWCQEVQMEYEQNKWSKLDRMGKVNKKRRQLFSKTRK